MIPIRDRAETEITPIITYLLIGVNILIFIYMQTLGRNELANFVANYALFGEFILQGEMLHTLFTSTFLHGSLGHLFSNMLFLKVFGDNLEEAFGPIKFILFYLICGLLASLTHIFVSPLTDVPTLGASGAIAGLMGSYLILFPKNKIDTLFIFGFIIRVITIPAFAILLYWIAYQLIIGVGSLGFPGAGGIAYFAHIGGFVAGLILTLISKPFIQKKDDKSNSEIERLNNSVEYIA